MGSIVGSQTGGPNATVAGNLVVGGTIVSTGNVSTTGRFLAGPDNIGAPAFSYTLDPDTGIYSAAADTLNTGVGGALSTQHTAGLVAVNGSTSANVNIAAVGTRLTATATQDITAVGTAITFTGENKTISTSGGNIVSTAAPTITGGVAGDKLILRKTGANSFTISDKGTLPGSGLTLPAALIVLDVGDAIELLCTAPNAWTAIAPNVNNV